MKGKTSTFFPLKKSISLKKEIASLPDSEINTNSLNKTIKQLQQAIESTDPLESINRELNDIQRGLYQHQLYEFTYNISPDFMSGKCLSQDPIARRVGNKELQDRESYMVFPIMDLHGLKCTATIPIPPLRTVEIQINFFGTIDFASKVVDIEKGGPGQETLKRHEEKLLRQIDSVLEQMSTLFPDKTLRLRLAGHSLGGALAKGVAHSIQRARAIQEDSPKDIITRIKEELSKEKYITNRVSPNVFQSLEERLNTDQAKFKELKALSKIEGITIYGLGAPGLSKTTDEHASLLTYYHQPDFLRVYNHFHREDLSPKFGEVEFLSGKSGIIPRIVANKVIQYDAKITAAEVTAQEPLPFPGLTKRVMAAHNKLIYDSKQSVESTVYELNECNFLLEKFTFSIFKHALYDATFFFARFLASHETMVKLIPDLKSYPEHDIETPDISTVKGCF